MDLFQVHSQLLCSLCPTCGSGCMIGSIEMGKSVLDCLLPKLGIKNTDSLFILEIAYLSFCFVHCFGLFSNSRGWIKVFICADCFSFFFLLIHRVSQHVAQSGLTLLCSPG